MGAVEYGDCADCGGVGRISAGRRGANDPELRVFRCTSCNGTGEIVMLREGRRERLERFLDLWIDANGWAAPFHVAVQVGASRFPLTWASFSDAGLEALAAQLVKSFWRSRREARLSREHYTSTRAA